jgi:hypothetical protein
VGLIAEGGIELVELEMANEQIAEEVRLHFFGMGAGRGELEAQSGGRQAEEALYIGLG